MKNSGVSTSGVNTFKNQTFHCLENLKKKKNDILRVTQESKLKFHPTMKKHKCNNNASACASSKFCG